MNGARTYIGVEAASSGVSVAVPTAEGVAAAVLGEGSLVSGAAAATATGSLRSRDGSGRSLGAGGYWLGGVGARQTLRIVGVANHAGVAGHAGLVASEALAATLSVCCCSRVGGCAKGNCREKESIEEHDAKERMCYLKVGLYG